MYLGKELKVSCSWCKLLKYHKKATLTILKVQFFFFFSFESRGTWTLFLYLPQSIPSVFMMAMSETFMLSREIRRYKELKELKSWTSGIHRKIAAENTISLTLERVILLLRIFQSRVLAGGTDFVHRCQTLPCLEG